MDPLLVKLAFKITKPETKAEIHFMSAKPDWAAFEKNLKSKLFQKAVVSAPEADAVLRRYVKNYGGYVQSKDVVAKLKSGDSGKTYTIKDLHNGRFGCNCGDWQYKHAPHGGNCKHIKKLKNSGLLEET